MMKIALGVSGKRERKDKGWFAVHKNVTMELVNKRNLLEA